MSQVKKKPAAARPASGPGPPSQTEPAPRAGAQPSELARQLALVVPAPAGRAQRLDFSLLERDFATENLLHRRSNLSALGAGLGDLADRAQRDSDFYHATALRSDGLLLEGDQVAGPQREGLLEIERAARATLLAHEERIETAAPLTASFPAYGARELAGWAGELDDAAAALDGVLGAIPAGPATGPEVSRLREECLLLRRSAVDLGRDSNRLVSRAAVHVPVASTSFVPAEPLPDVDIMASVHEFRQLMDSAMPVTDPTPEEEANYSELLRGAVRLEALGLLFAHRQHVLDEAADPRPTLSGLANPMGEFRRAADEVHTLDRLRERLVADRTALRAVGWDVLFQRVSIDQAADVLARYGPELADEQQRGRWAAKLEQAGSEGRTRNVLWQIAREFEAVRVRQIPAVDLALSRLYEAFPLMSTLSAAAVVEGWYGDDRQLTEAVASARGRLVENIDIAIGRIAAGRINPLDLPVAVAVTRTKLPPAAGSALDSAVAAHESARFWLGMGLTAAEILVTFIPVAGPGLALALGAVQLGMQVGNLADRAMLARVATTPYGDPLGVRPVSSFEWVMLGVQAALVAGSAYSIYRTFRASAAAAGAAAAEREAGAAAARELRARLNASTTSGTSPGAPGSTTPTTSGVAGQTTSTTSGAAGQTTSTSSRAGGTPPPTPKPPVTPGSGAAATSGAAQRILVHDFQAGFLRFRFSATARAWAAFNAMPPGYAVYQVRNAAGQIIYVGITGRVGLARWGEHLAEQGGEWLGQATRFEFVAVGLDSERLALALEDDLMRQLKPQFNRQRTFEMRFRRPPLGAEIPRTNAHIVLDLSHR